MTKKNKNISVEKQIKQVENSLEQLATNLHSPYGPYQSAALSQTAPFYSNLRWYLISNNRQLLNQMYVEHGLVQTLVDQPVDDAFRAGFEIKSSQLEGDDIEQLQQYLEEFDVIRELMQAAKWARLFGGGGVVIITPQDPETELDLEAIDENTPIMYRAVDMWELTGNYPLNANPNLASIQEVKEDYYSYYGVKLHPSRVLRINGKAAPSLVRPRLRGWGMSELERVIRSFNQYLKNQDVVYELIDEAKIDVYKMKGFNTALAAANGTESVSRRIQSSNLIKNYNNAITMDAEDEYEQKQITFSGLGDMLTQIRQGIASDMKMPLTKLFGISSAGFNSGEDDIENYNSMVDGEVRAKTKFKVIFLLKIACQKLFGFIPDDLDISWPSLRILNADEQENVKDKQFKRVMEAWKNGMSDDVEAREQINKASLLPIEIKTTGAIGDPKGELAPSGSSEIKSLKEEDELTNGKKKTK